MTHFSNFYIFKVSFRFYSSSTYFVKWFSAETSRRNIYGNYIQWIQAVTIRNKESGFRVCATCDKHGFSLLLPNSTKQVWQILVFFWNNTKTHRTFFTQKESEIHIFFKKHAYFPTSSQFQGLGWEVILIPISALISVIVCRWELFELNYIFFSKSKIKLYHQTNITEWGKNTKINSVKKEIIYTFYALLASEKINKFQI